MPAGIDISKLWLLTPEIVMTVLASTVLLMDLALKDNKRILAYISIAFVAAISWFIPSYEGTAFGGMFVADGYAAFFKIIFNVGLILTLLISMRYIEEQKMNFGEYYALLLFSTLGMMIMASAADLIVLYIGLELMALSIYVLAGFQRYNQLSNEASLKYFLMGAFSSALLLYAISMVYGMTGTTEIKAVAAHISQSGLAHNPVFMITIALFIAAFGFKVAAAPFHMWAPDVYEGSPTAVTAFMSAGPKAAAFAAMGRVFLGAFEPLSADWIPLLSGVAILTMAVGNILALSQTNIKRMLAYSSIAHAGYALIGIVAGSTDGMASTINYLLIYSFMNIGAFAIVILLRKDGQECQSINDYEGLSRTNPFYAFLMLVFMFSLTGIPPTAGFIGKFNIFMTAIKAGHTGLVVSAVVFSAISAFFYLRIVMFMYVKEPSCEVTTAPAPALTFAMLLSLGFVLAIGILPSGFVNLAKMASLL